MKVTLVFVPPGGGETDYSLDFDLPAVPRTGDYICIRRPGGEVGQEEFIVRRSWWSLVYPVSGDSSRSIVKLKLGSIPAGATVANESPNPPPVGSLSQLVVECEFALGPYPTDGHKRSCEIYKQRKGSLKEFDNSVY